MPTSATAIIFQLIIFAAVAGGASTLGLEEMDAVKMVQAQIARVRDWVHELGREQQGLGLDAEGKNLPQVCLDECNDLYEESAQRVANLVGNANHTRDDARTWLSAALANHRTCLGGLGQLGGHAMTQNLTSGLSQSLALYARRRNRPGRRGVPRGGHGGINRGLLASWAPGRSRADLIVAKDGSGTHRTINDAVAALDRLGKRGGIRRVIYVKAGVYHENVLITKHQQNVMFVGDGIDRTIVTGNRNLHGGSTTIRSATFGVAADGFWARDMTFENTAGPNKHQAVALRVSSDRSIFYRCSFKGYRDTLYVHSLRQFYRDCQIYGTIDMIFGDASAVFQNCDIFVRRPMAKQTPTITAQGRDDPNENTGISIQMSRVRPAPDFVGVKNLFRSYLGRPWKQYSRTVFLRSDLDGLIDPAGWKEWAGNFALSTSYCGENKNTGAGSSTARRVRWPGYHVLRRPIEALPFSVNALIQGGEWIPDAGVPLDLGI